VARLICWPSVIPCSFPNSRPHAPTRATEKRGQREIEREKGRRREGVQRLAKQRKGSSAGGVPCNGGARIPELGIPTFTSIKKISYFLTAMGENTIKYGGARPRSYFFYCFRLQ
jgi:hypothetical protein